MYNDSVCTRCRYVHYTECTIIPFFLSKVKADRVTIIREIVTVNYTIYRVQWCINLLSCKVVYLSLWCWQINKIGKSFCNSVMIEDPMWPVKTSKRLVTTARRPDTFLSPKVNDFSITISVATFCTGGGEGYSKKFAVVNKTKEYSRINPVSFRVYIRNNFNV